MYTLGLEQWYWDWVIGYWVIFADIRWCCYWGIFFFVVSTNMTRLQSAASKIPHASERLFSSAGDLYSLMSVQSFVWTPCWYASVY